MEQILKSDELTRRRFMNHTSKALLGVSVLPGITLSAFGADIKKGDKIISAPTPTPGRKPTARNIIYLYMSGGMTHLDTFDPKPGTEEAGGVKAIPTTVDGTQVSLRLLLLAGLGELRPRPRFWPRGTTPKRLFCQSSVKPCSSAQNVWSRTKIWPVPQQSTARSSILRWELQSEWRRGGD